MREECFSWLAALQPQTPLISLNSSEMHCQLPAARHTPLLRSAALFNKVGRRDGEMNAIPFSDDPRRKMIPPQSVWGDGNATRSPSSVCWTHHIQHGIHWKGRYWHFLSLPDWPTLIALLRGATTLTMFENVGFSFLLCVGHVRIGQNGP